uniref:Uncharacterized protein n=1 Tax=Oryza brachyantha TaxID=4533 RepID=J3M5J4_ORYBR
MTGARVQACRRRSLGKLFSASSSSSATSTGTQAHRQRGLRELLYLFLSVGHQHWNPNRETQRCLRRKHMKKKQSSHSSIDLSSLPPWSGLDWFLGKLVGDDARHTTRLRRLAQPRCDTWIRGKISPTVPPPFLGKLIDDAAHHTARLRC